MKQKDYLNELIETYTIHQLALKMGFGYYLLKRKNIKDKNKLKKLIKTLEKALKEREVLEAI